MSISKEWLKNKISEMESACDEIPFGLDEESASMLIVLNQALADREELERLRAQEPIAWTDEQELRDLAKHKCAYLFTVDRENPYHDPRRQIMLYADPKPLAVPDAVSVARAALDYIDALPDEVVATLPVMPGFDRDWAEDVLSGNYPVIPDRWIPCSERMPEKGVDVLACKISLLGGYDEIETAQWHGGMKVEQPVFITSADTIEPELWMPLPAAPEVK